MRALAASALLLFLPCSDGLAPVGSLHAQQRHCEPTKDPKTLPPVGLVLDSARAVEGLSPQFLGPHGVLLSLVYSEADSLPQVHVLEASIDSAGLLLANSLLPQKSKHLWAVRVRVAGTGTDAVAVTLERSSYCPPVLVTKPALSEVIMVNPRPGDRRMPGLNPRIDADVVIAASGLVTEVRLSQSSGMREFDEQVVQMLRMRRYLPALIDGFPVISWWRTDGRTMQL